MSVIAKALEANRNYAKNYDPTLAKHPAPKIVVVGAQATPVSCSG